MCSVHDASVDDYFWSSVHRRSFFGDDVMLLARQWYIAIVQSIGRLKFDTLSPVLMAPFSSSDCSNWHKTVCAFLPCPHYQGCPPIQNIRTSMFSIVSYIPTSFWVVSCIHAYIAIAPLPSLLKKNKTRHGNSSQMICTSMTLMSIEPLRFFWRLPRGNY